MASGSTAARKSFVVIGHRIARLAASGSDAAQWSALGVQRIGDASEATAVVLGLCSDATSLVTGHSMMVDGGVSSLLRRAASRAASTSASVRSAGA
ncbi:SDR family oxidoreductase [Myxococcus sp. Y35]|uniref:SDR family oxidoreductase n=1 Tax=Pseudomyxococcus flavus TaxID=3115648 RepID=UPI003CEB33A5